jgi:hypothetical protein
MTICWWSERTAANGGIIPDGIPSAGTAPPTRDAPYSSSLALSSRVRCVTGSCPAGPDCREIYGRNSTQPAAAPHDTSADAARHPYGTITRVRTPRNQPWDEAPYLDTATAGICPTPASSSPRRLPANTAPLLTSGRVCRLPHRHSVLATCATCALWPPPGRSGSPVSRGPTVRIVEGRQAGGPRRVPHLRRRCAAGALRRRSRPDTRWSNG